MLKNFSEALNDDERALIIESLHKVMKPFLLRRVKSDVMKDVPQKVERIVHGPLSKLQTKIHRF
jgi:SNF2 family DNA or RNA helicase